MSSGAEHRAPVLSLSAPTDIPGHFLAVHTEYRRWFGQSYDLGALDCVLATAAAEKLGGDPPWLLVVSGSGAAKTETVMPLQAAGAVVASTISGEAALLSGTSTKERAKDATGGLLRRLGDRGLLVIKDVTSILSMNRDTRALVLAALREIYDGQWSREIGADGGKTLTWTGRLVVIGAVTTAWDSAHAVIATMGDRFLLVRVDSTAPAGRRHAGLQALANVDREAVMREALRTAVAKLLGAVSTTRPAPTLREDEMVQLFDLADIVTRARTAVERDYSGDVVSAHAPEMPTRLTKQLAQIARGGMALGMPRAFALATAVRCAGDTMPPLRLRALADIAGNSGSETKDVVKRLQMPRKTVDRVLQELHLLGLLTVHDVQHGTSTRWAYTLAEAVDRPALDALHARKWPGMSVGAYCPVCCGPLEAGATEHPYPPCTPEGAA